MTTAPKAAQPIARRVRPCIAGGAYYGGYHAYPPPAYYLFPVVVANERAADGHPYGGHVSGHPLDPLRTRRPRLERIAEILGLAGHLSIEELHDAHGVRRPPIIG
jgi:hypothetical protein